jgi:hypothetical protein
VLIRCRIVVSAHRAEPHGTLIRSIERPSKIHLLLDEVETLIEAGMRVGELVDHRARALELLLILHVLKASGKPLHLLMKLADLQVLRL